MSAAPTTDPRSEARRLAEAGRGLDAIRLLTEANRADPDADVEADLVELRHRAFSEINGQGRSSWPPDFPDLFADVEGLPEIAVDELTTEAVGAGILHHGALCVRGFATPERVEHLIEAVDAAFDAYDARRDGAPLEQTRPWFVSYNPPDVDLLPGEKWWIRAGGGVWTADSPRGLWRVTEAFEAVGLRDVLAGYFGEPPAMSVKKSTLRRVPVDSGTDWHQDGAFLGDDIRTVNVWLVLTACGGDADAPGLDIVPRRFDEVLETGTRGAQFDWSVGPGLVDEVAGDAGVIRPVFQPGDALLFDQRFLHRTGIGDHMTRERHAIENWFFAPSAYPFDQVPLVF